MRPSLPPPPPPAPPPPGAPPPPLRAQIERDFGSVDAFLQTLGRMCADRRHGGFVSLVASPGGRLRLVHTPPSATPPGLVLCRFPAGGAPPQPPDWRGAGERFGRYMALRPPYPMP